MRQSDLCGGWCTYNNIKVSEASQDIRYRHKMQCLSFCLGCLSFGEGDWIRNQRRLDEHARLHNEAMLWDDVYAEINTSADPPCYELASGISVPGWALVAGSHQLRVNDAVMLHLSVTDWGHKLGFYR